MLRNDDSIIWQGGQIYNHTMTDIAKDVRQDRLKEVYSIISEVNTALGLNSSAESRWEWMAGVPLPVWIVLVSCLVLAVCFCIARILHGDVSVLARGRMALRRKHSSAVV